MIPTENEQDSPRPLVSRMASSRLGQVIAGSYRLERFLAAGGSCDVYAAEHLRLGKSFAVKLLRLDTGHTEAAIERFRREARAIARITSEYVVTIVDCGELDDHTPYLVMELLEGEDLRALLQRERELPVRRAVRLLLEACSGLAQVHAAGLVHRDIKPENLFITRRTSGEEWCKLLDFGVAKMEASRATAQGVIVGTVRYMAPEQLADGMQVSAATDIHAIGLLLFECLAGRPAYVGDTVQELMYQVMNSEPPSLAELRPELPRAIVSLAHRCLSKLPAARPQSAEELIRLLRNQTDPLAAGWHATLSDTWPVSELVGPKPRRLTGWWALPIAGALALGSFAYPSMTQRSKTSAAPLAPPSGATTASSPAEEPAPALPPGDAASVSATLSEPNTIVPVLVAPVPIAPTPAHEVRPSTASSRRVAGSALRPASLPQSGVLPLSIGHFDQANPYEE